MKNIFKKTSTFIISRLLYLIFGIFLAIGATYVYATWDAARTSGSGQLTEANWNELVTMIENNIGAGGVTWMGYTAHYGGNMGGTKGMNTICNTTFAGSHACTWDEIIKLGTSYPWTSNAWIVDGAISINDNANSITKDGYTVGNPWPNCKGWTSSITTVSGACAIAVKSREELIIGTLGLAYCDGQQYNAQVPCCK